MTRCKTKGCPFTLDEHEEWMALCRQAPEHGHRDDQPSHQHIPKKGMGGHNKKSKIQAVLCWPLHDRIDNKDWGNAVLTTTEEGRRIETYRAWDLHNKTIIERVLEPDSAAEEAVVGEESTVEASPSSSAPSGSESPAVEQQTNRERVLSVGADSSTAEPSEGGDDGPNIPEAQDETAKVPSREAPLLGGALRSHQRNNLPDDDSGSEVLPTLPTDTDSRSLPRLTYESWAEQIIRVAKKGHNWQFELGDLANEGESKFGEEAWQTLSELGIQPETLSNQMRVAAAIPPSLRRGELKWSFHQVIYKQDKETIEAWLDRCVEEQWNIRQFKDALCSEGLLPPKKTVKRWAVPEMREMIQEFLHWQASPLPISAIKDDGSSVENFCTFLEEQG